MSDVVPAPARPSTVATQLSASEVLVGREEPLELLGRHDSGVLVLTGDSGVGKTRLLVSAFSRHSPGEAALTTFRGTSGSIQVALLEALSQVLLDWQGAQVGTTRLRMAASRVAQRAAKSTGTQMGKVAGRLILDYLRTKIGEEAVDIIDGIAKDLVTPNDALLEQRIHSARDDDALAAFLALAEEVQELLGNFTIYVDNLDRLTADDYSAFVDLCDRLPDGVAIISAMAVTNADEKIRVRQAVRRGIARVELDQLSVADVREWLKLCGVSATSAEQVHRLSSGYPLFVETCVSLLQMGRSLVDVEVSESFRSLTEQAWTELTDNTQAAAQLLLAFDVPPPLEVITNIVGIDANAWVVIENRMREARVFCAAGNGRYWFHDRRRRIIWEEILSGEQRKLIAERVVPTLAMLATSDEDGPDILLPLAALASDAASFIGENPELSRVLDLPSTDLATLYAALELLEPVNDEPAFLQTSQLLGYRRRLFPLADDGVGSVERLVAAELLYVASNEHASVATTTLPSQIAVKVLGGQFLQHMGRLPMTRAATATFDIALRPLIEPFKLAAYGIGSPKFAETIRQFDLGSPLLLVSGELGVRRFYLVAAFHSVDARDAAAERVEASTSVDVFDDEFVIVASVIHPWPVASDRLLMALGDMYNIGNGTLSSGLAPRIQPEGSMTALRAARAKSKIHEFARLRLAQIERLAADCDEGLALYVDERDDGCLEAEVRTDTARVEAVEIPRWITMGPLQFLEVTDRLNLGPEESLHTLYHYSRPTGDPTIEVLLRLRRDAIKFNTVGAQYSLPRDEGVLRADIEKALDLRWRDIQALRELVLDVTVAPRDQVGRHLVWIYSGRDGWNSGGARQYFATDLVIPGDDLSVEVRFVDVDPQVPWEGLAAWLSERGFESRQDENIRLSHGDASHVLGPLLGYAPQNVRVWPDVSSF